MKRQSGFTLIELIIVIVILGILAVTVAPQFFNFGRDARASTVRGVEGSMQSASELVHARFLISGAEGNLITVRPGVNVEVDPATGYATATHKGIVSALNLDIAVAEKTPENHDWVWVSVDTSIAIRPASESENADCQVLYTPASRGVATDETGSIPSITSTITGC